MRSFSTDDCGSGKTCEKGETAEAEERRTIVVHKTKKGFGIDAERKFYEGCSIRFINGKLHTPHPSIKTILTFNREATEKAGIKKRCELLKVNGNNLEEATPDEIIHLIKFSNELVLTLTSFAPQTSERINSSLSTSTDLSNKEEFPISVPDYKWIVKNGEILVVYKIYIAGRYLCSKRYSEFYTLHVDLQEIFPAFDFPLLPEKWPFSLSVQQLNARRSGLEKYLRNICSVEIIAVNAIVQKFLKCIDDENGGFSEAADVKILLPNRISVVVNVRKDSCTKEVYQALVEKIGMSKDVSQYFRLFEIADSGFERILLRFECPWYRYIQNDREDISTCILMRKWIFTLSKEIEISEDSMAASFFFWQAIDDINKGQIKPGSKINEIKALQKYSTKYEYIRLVRLLDGYGEISFPHCACDAREEGHVIATVSIKSFRLQACKEDGTLELPVIEISWDRIKKWEIEVSDWAFSFQYSRPNKLPRCVKLYTEYSVSMLVSFRTIQSEQKWLKSTDSEQ